MLPLHYTITLIPPLLLLLLLLLLQQRPRLPLLHLPVPVLVQPKSPRQQGRLAVGRYPAPVEAVEVGVVGVGVVEVGGEVEVGEVGVEVGVILISLNWVEGSRN